MATTSITKQFTVKTPEAYKRLMAEIEKQPSRKTEYNSSSSLEKGRSLLEQFSSR